MNLINNYLLFIPQLIFVCFVFSLILVIFIIRIKEGNCDLPKYFSNYVRTSYSKRTFVDIMFSVIDLIFKFIMISFILCVVTYSIYSFFPRVAIDYFFDLKKVMPDDILEWVTLMITLAAILVAFKKDYYLVFSIEEVLERYKFKSKIFTIVNIMLVNRLILLLKPLKVKEIYLFAFDFIYIVLYFIAVAIGCYLIYRVMYLLYSKEQSELELLDKLFYKVKNRVFHFENNSNVNITGIILNGEYLFDQYVNYYSRVMKYDICKMKFESVYNGYKNDVYKKIKKVIVLKGSVLLCALYLVQIIFIIRLRVYNGDYYFTDEIKFFLISIVTWGLCVIILNLVGVCKCLNNFKLLINRMFLSDYIYTYEDKLGNRYFTSTFGISVGKINSKYFISILNLVVYFKMLLNGSTVAEVDEFVEHIENMCNEPKYRDYCNDEIFHIINIYFAFLRFSMCDVNDKNELISSLKRKKLSKVIKKRRVQGLAKAIILNTQNLFHDDGIKLWTEFTNCFRENS